MQLKNGLQQFGLELPDGVERAGDHDPAAGDAEARVSHEEEVHQRRLVEVQRPTGIAGHQVVHVQVRQPNLVHEFCPPDLVEKPALGLVALGADRGEEVPHVEHLGSPGTEVLGEGAVLRLELDAVEALVDLHGLERPRHDGVHLETRLVHDDELQAPGLAINAADVALDGRPDPRSRPLPGEDLRDHAAHGAAAQALDRRHGHRDHAVHTRLEYALLSEVEGAPARCRHRQHCSGGALQLQAIASEALHLIQGDGHDDLARRPQGRQELLAICLRWDGI
mmetsp:Transcript_38852/g.111633  ORF Transcript_38852/g.111633 Transcript_38852/m.111633 type:complete len:280 (-) Transcript_38852:910-1749(-)